MCKADNQKRIYYWDVVSDVEFMFGCGTRVCGAIGVRFYPDYGVNEAIDAYLDEFSRERRS